MKKLLMLGLLLIIPACSWFRPGCYLQDQGVTIATAVVVEQGECADPEAVRADLKEVVEKLGLCSETHQTGPIADTVCPLLSQGVVNYITSTAIPATWKCKTTNLKEKVGQALTDACKKIPVKK